ncbi:hypothetical protein [Marixanthomonas ophiurae]|uniref:Uncharacterized protein n=1 Tax=Marixanthomonas ophiurae TaxID=387659 RepID=A0A3E1QE83_9FLAO|nr:hypothetical protein [Marixanthomonas ophiurae]MAT90255.1 hypothetical protein [Flavobacteriaceae bacterium]RFN60366.1 hypothetical protein DZ858_10100 [Marixanthomonas ophiurae]|tara:strand:+ start:1754 stop:2089 length:336 start_codon:yes stop_codon:yes gene_type:complete
MATPVQIDAISFGCRLLLCFAFNKENEHIFLKEKEKKESRFADGVAFLSSFLEKIVRLDRVLKKVRHFVAYYFFQNPCGLSFTGILRWALEAIYICLLFTLSVSLVSKLNL